MQNMLKNLKKMILNPRMEDVLGMLEQLIKNLLGKNGPQWREDLAKMLRKELLSFRHDSMFDLKYGLEKPELKSFNRDIGPAEAMRELEKLRFRMATTEEAIAYLGWEKVGDVSFLIFSHCGPRRYPCAIHFCRKGSQFQMQILSNSDTSRWLAGAQLLVYQLST